MKLYFSGSIRGAIADREIYRILVDHLKEYGTVLTEHIADVNELDDNELDDNEIFKRDLEWLKSADVLVAEVTASSLGVGYEIGRAEEFGIPVLCVYQVQTGKTLSAMINGNDYLTVKKYKTVKEATEIIDEFLTHSFV